MGAGLQPMPEMGRWHFDRERVVDASGLAWTFLRPSTLMSNALQWADKIKSEGVVYDSIGEGEIAPVDPRDVAAVAAAALINPERHERKIYDLTGPQLLTARQQVEILAAVLERPIHYRYVPPEQAAEEMRKAGTPPFLVDATVELWATIRSGQVAVIAPAVEELTGHAPGAFERWCHDHAAVFRSQ
jgi:uncharacterized protein YbjT (DUF2867 family)